jgi:hypothetical protein
LHDEQQRRETEQNAASNRLQQLNRDWEEERSTLQKQLEDREMCGSGYHTLYSSYLSSPHALCLHLMHSFLARKDEEHRGEVQRAVDHAVRSYTYALESRDKTLEEVRQQLRSANEERSKAEMERCDFICALK